MPIRIQAQPRVPNTFLFGNSLQMYHKLHWEFRELRERMHPNDDLMGPRLVAFSAFNFAVTAWHLTDWSLGEVASTSYTRNLLLQR